MRTTIGGMCSKESGIESSSTFIRDLLPIVSERPCYPAFMAFALKRSRGTALAAVVALLAVLQMPALSLLHGLGGDDVCYSALGQDNASARTIRGATEVPLSPHCPICHWWQSAGHFKSSSPPSTLVLIVGFGLVVKPLIVVPELSVTTVGSVRAPPAA
jgi:hypothetical protein